MPSATSTHTESMAGACPAEHVTRAHTFNREHAQSNLSMLTEPSSACENANNSLKKHLTVNLHIFGQEQKHFALFFTYLEQAFHTS